MFLGCGKPNNLRILSKELEYNVSSGVHIDKNLKFRKHIDHVVEKLIILCGLMYRERHLYPRKCFLSFYTSFAKSIKTYGFVSYGTSCKTNMTKIDAVQRRNFRAIFFKEINSLEKVLLITKI